MAVRSHKHPRIQLPKIMKTKGILTANPQNDDLESQENQINAQLVSGTPP